MQVRLDELLAIGDHRDIVTYRKAAQGQILIHCLVCNSTITMASHAKALQYLTNCHFIPQGRCATPSKVMC